MKDRDMKIQKPNYICASKSGKIGRLASGIAVFVLAATGVMATENMAPKDLGQFYLKNCARCHGETGNGRDASGKHLPGAVFTDPRWQQNTNDTAMAKVILKGIFFGWVMPSFKDSLSQEEALRLVKDILHKKLGAQVPK